MFHPPLCSTERHKNCRKIIVEQLKIFLECVWLSLLPMQYTSRRYTLIKLSHKEAAELQCKQGGCSTAVCSHRVSGCCSRGRHCCRVDHAGQCMSRVLTCVTMLSRSRHRVPRVLTASAQCPLCSDSRAVVPRLVRCARRRESVRTAPTFIPPSSRGRGATATPSIRSTTHYRGQQVVLTGTN